MRFLPEHNIAAAVIGFGYVGSAVGSALAEGGATVVGIDADATFVEELRNRYCRFSEPGLPELMFRMMDAERLTVTTDYAAVSTADVVVLTVGTPVHEGGALSDTQLRGACERLAGRLRKGQLVILKSTVPPGVTRDLVVPILESGGLVCGEDFGVAFCPERFAEGAFLRELRSHPVVVGGWCADSADAAVAFWQRVIDADTIRCSSMEAAEVVKLASNWWIDHNIAMANELAKLCGTLDVDVLEVIAATNSIRKGNGSVNILLPSVGVGGSCLTKDPWMVWKAARDRGVALRTIPVAREVNEGMPEYTVDTIVDQLAALGVPLAKAKVAVLGLAFKNNTGDLRATPTLPVVAKLREGGAEVAVFDPLTESAEVEQRFGLVPASSVEDAVDGADCIAVLARHDAFDAIDFGALRERVAPSCVIIDGRAYYPPDTIARLQEQGFAYRGIGR